MDLPAVEDFAEEESSSGDEGFFTPKNNKLHNVEMGNGNGQIGNGHLSFEDDGSAAITKKKKKKDKQVEPSDIEQNECVDNEVPKEKKKKKKEKKEKKEKKKKKDKDNEEE